MNGRLPRGRWALLALLLVGEGIALGVRFDTAPLTHLGPQWWAQLLGRVSIVLPLATAMATAIALIAGRPLWHELQHLPVERARAHRTWAYLAVHLAAFALFYRLSAIVIEGDWSGSSTLGLWAGAWLATGAVVAGSWAASMLPLRSAVRLLQQASRMLAAGALVGMAAWVAGNWTSEWWRPLAALTLRSVGFLVGLIAPDAIVRLDDLVVGTARFWVEIAPECSGYEGVGLISVFLAAYLWLFRRTLRFPAAFLLLPAGMVLVWLANVLRIAGLVAIGTWGSPAIALGGFHSYSGSLLFSAVALGIAFAAERSRFFTSVEFDDDAAGSARAVAAYLMPLVVTLATALLTGAFAAGTVDVLYPLRVVAVGATLWHFRREYTSLRWTWSWRAILGGTVAFLLWLGLAPGASPDAALIAPPARWPQLWVVWRAVGAVVTVPLAEELAFRGYLTRRVQGRRFEALPFRFSWSGLVVSSVLFGSLHSRFVAATACGLLYTLVLYRRGELTDAVIAHATTNLLLTLYVLATGAWFLWS